MPAPGPSALGRGVVVNAGGPVPAPWRDAPVIPVDETALAGPAAAVTALHACWSERRPAVVALAVDPARFRAPESWPVEPWTVGAGFDPWLDRLHFLVWANTYDARAGGGEPVWWWARKAERAGARSTPGGPADIVLPDGRPAWVDGGPRGPIAPAAVDGAPVVHTESVELGRLTVAPPPSAPKAQLAPDQLAAVAHGAGPARVIAPAGSGKTRVLTERLRHLLVDRGLERECVLAVAYNKKAQEELVARTAAFQPRVRTLNALGYDVVTRARGHRPGLLEERDVRRIVDDLVPKGQRRANTDRLGPYLEALSLVRLGLRDPEEVEESRDDVPGLARAFAAYRARLAESGAVDFDEQVYGAVEALLADGALRRAAQAGCRHLLVDEFQDLTPAHVVLLRLLAAPALDVFGVGDDDQVIYGHAGADPAFLVDYARWFPGAADHRLEVNYRCPSAVVDGARTLLGYNRRRVVKEIRSGPGADRSPDGLVVLPHRPEGGGTAVVEVVQRWLAEPGVDRAGVAVLTRVNSMLLAPHVALAEAGLPLNSVLRPTVLDRTGVRAALAYLRIAAGPEHIAGSDVAEVYRRPSRGLPQWITKWFRGHFTLPRLRAIADKLDDAKVATRVDDLVDDLGLVIDAARTGTTRDVLAAVKDRVGLGGAMGLLDSTGVGDGGSSHLDDLEALEQVAGLHPHPATFEGWLRAAFQREAVPGGVTLSTVHRVKGMEWDRVAVFGVTAGLVPHRLAEDVEEERRVLHVAVTRGRQRVAVLTDQSRPSLFLAELAGTAPEPSGLPLEVPPTLIVAGGRRPPRRAPSAGGEADAPLSAGEERAESALRAWRLERSRRDSVAAFIVLSNRHLRSVARARPRTLAELRRVDGIGPTKLELYGEEILAVLEALGDG
ncbi:MAG: ATP-dependent DNA helicase UvrD2 [Acidimicrobiales bacterium]